MTAGVIVLGFDSSAFLSDDDLNTAARNQYNFRVVILCRPCAHTKRVVYPDPPGTVAYLDHKEVKPKETCVLEFDDLNGAERWLTDKYEGLKEKIVFLTEPAVS